MEILPCTARVHAPYESGCEGGAPPPLGPRARDFSPLYPQTSLRAASASPEMCLVTQFLVRRAAPAVCQQLPWAQPGLVADQRGRGHLRLGHAVGSPRACSSAVLASHREMTAHHEMATCLPTPCCIRVPRRHRLVQCGSRKERLTHTLTCPHLQGLPRSTKC